MKIKIKQNAHKIYIEKQAGAPYSCEVDWTWYGILKIISDIGELEVDETYLFANKFNTKPIDGVSDIGLTLDDCYVSQVIDDVRSGKVYCAFCKTTVNKSFDGVCEACGKIGYLETIE